MSKPDLFPTPTTAGIVVDPKTLARVIPESRRSDGSVRKQIKIRPGFTPQEDVSRFRGTKQVQMDANTLPKGHIPGWVPPASSASNSTPKSKSAKKNEKRKEKRKEKVAETPKVKDSWEDEDEEEVASGALPKSAEDSSAQPIKPRTAEDKLVEKLEKLEVR